MSKNLDNHPAASTILRFHSHTLRLLNGTAARLGGCPCRESLESQSIALPRFYNSLISSPPIRHRHHHAFHVQSLPSPEVDKKRDNNEEFFSLLVGNFFDKPLTFLKDSTNKVQDLHGGNFVCRSTFAFSSVMSWGGLWKSQLISVDLNNSIVINNWMLCIFSGLNWTSTSVDWCNYSTSTIKNNS